MNDDNENNVFVNVLNDISNEMEAVNNANITSGAALTGIQIMARAVYWLSVFLVHMGHHPALRATVYLMAERIAELNYNHTNGAPYVTH